jgi:GNAT superfamily N-acetyltransferase
MWWRMTAQQFNAETREARRRALHELVANGSVPGLLAYLGGRPVGWCALAPRAAFGRLERSPKLRAVDDSPVWSVVCFYVDPARRGQGVAAALLAGAQRHVEGLGAGTLEGYPLDPQDPAGPRVNATSAYTGVVAMFEAAGFREVARRGGRPIMRWKPAADLARPARGSPSDG